MLLKYIIIIYKNIYKYNKIIANFKEKNILIFSLINSIKKILNIKT